MFAKVVFVGLLASCLAQTWRTVTMDEADKYVVSWLRVDDEVTFRVAVETTGWVGFGISPNGGMEGSDMAIMWVDGDGQVYLQDRYATGETAPKLDDSQDLVLTSGSESGGVTTVEFKRTLTNCDPDDNDLTSDALKLIYAYGSSDPVDDITYHGATRGSRTTYLLDEPVDIPVPADALTHDLMYETDFTVPHAEDTFYSCGVVKGPEVTEKHHVISFEPIITPGNQGFVHHMIAYGCYNPAIPDSHAENQIVYDCFDGSMPPELYGCMLAFTFSWAIGGGIYNFPEDAGFAIGDGTEPKFYLLQTHYDNPSKTPGRVDRSGLRLTYTPSTRVTDTGYMTVGAVEGIFVPPRVKDFTIVTGCVSECLQEALPDGGVEVFAYALHSHLLGAKLALRHFRGGEELEPLGIDNKYDFNFQETRHLTPRRKLLKGDHLLLTCTMDSSERDFVTYGGESTYQEMCLAFLYFTPKINLTVCYTQQAFTYLPVGEGQLKSLIGMPGEQSETQDWETFLQNVDWSREDSVSAAQKAVRDTSQGVQCRGPSYDEIIDENVFYDIEYTDPKPEPASCKEIGSGVMHTVSISLLLALYSILLA